MNKLYATLFSALVVGCAVCAGCTTKKVSSSAEVVDIIHKVNGYWQTNHPEHGRSFWDNAAYHTGNMEAYFLTNKPEYGENGLIVCADCAVLPNPTAEELAQIAVSTAATARAIAKIEPRVAMLSFSTKGSAKNELVDKVVKATELAKAMAPDVMIDGEMQADAALVPSVGASKAPGSPVAGKANVLIFPSLEVGNISYKLVQRIAGIEAVGPVLQGMAAPINDLSRGCSVSDIVNLVAITVNQAAGLN